MKRILGVLMLLVLVTGMAFARGGQEESGKPVLVMVTKGVHPYYEPCFEGFKDAAEKYGVIAEKVDPQKFELPLQVKVIEDLIARKVDGIAISALDDKGLVPVIDEATKAGIKVITFDAPAPSSAALTYIGTDNESAGYEAGKKMAELMGGEGEIIILQGGLGATNLNLRTKGFKRAIVEVAPNIKVLDVVDVQGDFAVAVNKTEAVLQAYPNLKAIFAVSAEGAPAAASVLKQQGKAGKIILGGFDDLKDTLEGIRDGSVAFCVVQKTYKMGWLSVEMLLKALKGEEIPKVIDTGVLFVTKENVDTYMEEMRKEFAAQ
ncbi:sugar-binding protein [Spirochaeta thermophila]|uniref:Ribose ABC transporter n=1 Tax=Winmispira thermophila (strain ATCC 49972 / DSM 6192 / RI 19.B1) TaxID=665571 RepID=E0RQT4_WINT6|nr:sugar-binding protein [Spirochaeta thermophila]ADN02990.1 ribose ABC transporter [Spirochaeta thermophila DSM 6192]